MSTNNNECKLIPIELYTESWSGKLYRMFFGEIIVLTACFMLGVSGSALHGNCYSNEDCGTLDTYCKNQTCVCRENFSVWDDTCVHLVTPRIPCKKKHDCRSVLGLRSLCTKDHFCACTPFHHLHKNQCVKNRDLHDGCQHDHQCYCGEDCEDKIGCIGKICSCRPGHKSYMIRRCIHDPNYIFQTPLPTTDFFEPETSSTLRSIKPTITNDNIERINLLSASHRNSLFYGLICLVSVILLL